LTPPTRSARPAEGSGRLIIVGCGIQLGRHVSQRCVSEIDAADVVFGLTDAWAAEWLRSLRPDCRDLTRFYGEDKDRRVTYREMVACMLDPVRRGLRVCAVFYGHPGVFAQVSHHALREAGAEGHRVRMEPGISAEDCLYADLGLDPGEHGVQQYEATQFLVCDRPLDPAALVILWQVALTGNVDCIGFAPHPARLALLVEKLRRWYRPDHEVILYEAAQVAIQAHRAERIALAGLSGARLREHTTLVIPSAAAARPDMPMRQRLAAL